MRRTIHLWIPAIVFCAVALGQEQQAVLGGITPKVVCAADLTQDYALFLPSRYDAKQKWPIIYAFDAAARGALPLELARAAAEKYGYIMAGSNQSQNFDPKARAAAVDCLWRDTHARLNLDDQRIYVAGFSGGSRLATELAQKCDPNFCVAGVIAHGAGFPDATPPKSAVKFAYFATVGELDFNHPEMIELRNQLEAMGSPNCLLVFPGPHQWGPADTWMEALAWLQVQAMRAGTIPRRSELIEAQLRAARERAVKAQAGGDLYTAWREYAGIVRDFAGLADVAEEQEKAAALKTEKPWKQAVKRERDAVQKQRALTGEMGRLYAQLNGDDSARTLVTHDFIGKMTELRERIAKQKDAAEKVVQQRALAEVTGMLFEGAQIDRLAKKWHLAAAKMEVASASVEQPTRGLVQAAKDYARAGDEGAAMRTLKRAVENGFKGRDELLKAEEFVQLRESEGFKKLVSAME